MSTIITDINPTVLRRTGIGRVAFSVTHTHHVEELHWVQREGVLNVSLPANKEVEELSLVGMMGFEPTMYLAYRILSPVCLASFTTSQYM